MLRSHAALWELTGSFEMLAFHTLFAGNMGQFGAPGTVVVAAAAAEPADAGRAEVTLTDDVRAEVPAVPAAWLVAHPALAAVTAIKPATVAARRVLVTKCPVSEATGASSHGRTTGTAVLL
jgi:hypothetical protein